MKFEISYILFAILLTSAFSGCSIIDDYVNKIENNEMYAVVSIRNIIIQQMYFKESKGRFVSWDEIRTPPKYEGYVFEMKSTKSHFQIWAVPQNYDYTGKKSYYFDSRTKTIHAADNGGKKISEIAPVIEKIDNILLDEN